MAKSLTELISKTEAIEDGAVDPTLQPFILINPFAKATVEPMHDVESPMEEVPAFHEEMPNSNRKLSREWGECRSETVLI